MSESGVTRRDFLRESAAIAAAGSAALTGGVSLAAGPTCPQRWLVIGGHPDDEAKAAALILTERKPADELIVLVMRLCGEGGIYGRKDFPREQCIATRSAEMEESARFLRARVRWWLPPHPAAVNIAATPENVEKMARLINEIRPTRILTHWEEEDPHPDHVGTSRLVQEAIKRLDFPGERELVFWGQLGREQHQKNFVPNRYVDISDPALLASVLWSFFLHRSQASLRYMEKHLNYYRFHGRQAGVEYAAGYVVNKLSRPA